MAMGRREKDIKLLVAKFVKLVESLNPGERLTIKKVASKKRTATTAGGKSAVKGAPGAPRREVSRAKASSAKAFGSKAPTTKASVTKA